MRLSAGKLLKKIKCLVIARFLDLTPAQKSDCENIYNWRNHELTRRYSLNSEIIPWETHQNWFNARIGSDQTLILVVRYFKREIGVVILNMEVPNSEISIYLVPGCHGKGYGLSILFAAEFWIKTKNKVTNLIARILPENKASISIFSDAGYEFVNSEKNYQLWQKKVSK